MSSSEIVALHTLLLPLRSTLGTPSPAHHIAESRHATEIAAVSTVCLCTANSGIAVGRSLGSMVVAYFALGATLALVNAFEFAVSWTTQQGWFGDGARPRIVGAYAVVFLIGLAVINAWLH